MHIYNTLTRKIEKFIPVKDNKVNMYVCGPTVYSDIHIGNARPVIFFDILKNYLRYIGYDVYYVSNITDIDDKIIEEARNKKITEKELTEHYTKEFIKASHKLGSNNPDLMPKATDYINEIIGYIKDLVDKNMAYITNTGVYFKTSKIDDYGKLSNQNIDELFENVRIDNELDKKDSKDFTLWKITEEGLNYESPWGRGRPGWHTECAVMNDSVFGDIIDIHGGGSDLIFPHHENEIAQTKAHSNHGLAKYWMHVGRVNMGNSKMSKSLGNTILVKDLKNPIAYRLLIIAHHYRLPINYSDELLLEFEQMYDRIIRTYKRTLLMLKINNVENSNKVFKETIKEFKKQMNDDLNTPNVVTIILEIIKDMNREKDLLKLDIYKNTLEEILKIFNLLPKIKVDEKLVDKYNKWEKYRLEKNFSEADKIRDELNKEGWI